MIFNVQKVGDPECHTVAQANIKNPRKKPVAAKKTSKGKTSKKK